MHCNLRPSHAAPVLIRYNFVDHTKFEVAQPIRCHPIAIFTADTLRYDVTLTSDFEYYTGCTVVKLCAKFECNRAIRGGVIAI